MSLPTKPLFSSFEIPEKFSITTQRKSKISPKLSTFSEILALKTQYCASRGYILRAKTTFPALKFRRNFPLEPEEHLKAPAALAAAAAM